jgi:hypothetical protein
VCGGVGDESADQYDGSFESKPTSRSSSDSADDIDVGGFFVDVLVGHGVLLFVVDGSSKW